MKRVKITEGEKPIAGENAIYELENYCSFVFSLAEGNCKHCYIDTFSYPSSILSENIVKVMKNIFRVNMKVTFGVNLTLQQNIDNISKFFTLISVSKIPTGYGNGYQYHAIFFTGVNVRDHDTYLERFKRELLKKEEEEKEKTVSSTLTREQVDKILSYKSKVWLEKYLNTLIS